MHYILFSLGDLHIYTYGFMIALGILIAYFVTEKRARQLGLDAGKLDQAALWVLVGGFACSKLLYWLTRFQDILKEPSILLDFANGWVVYGGILGGILGGYLFCRRQKLPFLEYFDLIIPQVALAQGFGRLGCFFAGCCYGIVTDGWFAIVFPEGSLAPANIGLFPTQLLSSAFDFLLFFFLLWMAKRKKFNGQLGAWYLILYSLGRFVIEFFRGDLIRGGLGTLSTSQIISLFAFAGGIAMLILLPKWQKMKAEKDGSL